MASKRKKDEVSKTIRFDSKKFNSQLAALRYEDDLINRSLVPERGIQLPADNVITKEIVRRGWEEFTKQPDAAVVPIVREFYANAVNAVDESKVYVRKKWVHFDTVTINKFYKMECNEMDSDEFELSGDINLHALTKKIAIDGAEWDMRDNEPINLKPSLLRVYARVWFSFIGAKLMPTTHFSTVNKERAIMIYEIASGKDVNVGEIIENSILQAVSQRTTGGLGHPHLITCLCRDAGVQWGRNEELLQPIKAIDESVIHSYKPRPHTAPQNMPKTYERRGKVSIADVGNRLSRLEDEVRDMRAELRQFYKYNVDFLSTMSGIIQRSGGPVTQQDVTWPTPPVFGTETVDDGDEC